MTRTNVVAALGAIVLGAGFVDAQEPPALEPPLEAAADAPSGSPPDPPPAERPRPAEPPPSRPLLVIPGVTAPPSRRAAQKPATGAATPSLDAPVVDPDIHLRLESIPDDEWPKSSARPRSTPTEAAKPAEAPATRGTSAFGRLLGPATGAGDRDDLSVESSGDPAVEAAVKRRVEKQIADALGGRVADVKVRVSGRSVSIHARATRLWYRWGARRTLETLPMPPGYRGRAVVD